MTRPVVHFEIVGSAPSQLRGFYGELFGWEFAVGDTVVGHFTDPEGNLIGLAGPK